MSSVPETWIGEETGSISSSGHNWEALGVALRLAKNASASSSCRGQFFETNCHYYIIGQLKLRSDPLRDWPRRPWMFFSR